MPPPLNRQDAGLQSIRSQATFKTRGAFARPKRPEIYQTNPPNKLENLNEK